MIVAVDAHYAADQTAIAVAGIHAWTDAVCAIEATTSWDSPAAAYEPGAFYKRELPAIMRGLALLGRVQPRVVIVDSYVMLAPGRPGLGRILHDALDGVPVMGVAKKPFKGTDAVAIPVTRGQSTTPLFVTTAGMDTQVAAAHLRAMHGPYRMPTVLKRVDRLARDTAAGARPPS